MPTPCHQPSSGSPVGQGVFWPPSARLLPNLSIRDPGRGRWGHFLGPWGPSAQAENPAGPQNWPEARLQPHLGSEPVSRPLGFPGQNVLVRGTDKGQHEVWHRCHSCAARGGRGDPSCRDVTVGSPQRLFLGLSCYCGNCLNIALPRGSWAHHAGTPAPNTERVGQGQAEGPRDLLSPRPRVPGVPPRAAPPPHLQWG